LRRPADRPDGVNVHRSRGRAMAGLARQARAPHQLRAARTHGCALRTVARSALNSGKRFSTA